MKYRDGKLTVPISGRYYIYEQIYYRGYRGKPIRISLLVNNKAVAMVHPPQTLRKSEFTFSTGGVFYLKAGDVITVAATNRVGTAYMDTYHSFFGAFLIWKKSFSRCLLMKIVILLCFWWRIKSWSVKMMSYLISLRFRTGYCLSPRVGWGIWGGVVYTGFRGTGVR